MNVKTLSNEILVQYYSNAMRTYMGALGHTKAEVNKRLADKYKTELEERKLRVPDWKEGGLFNGPGST